MHGDTALLCRTSASLLFTDRLLAAAGTAGMLPLLIHMIQSSTFTMRHVHVSALHPNQTTLKQGVGCGRTGSVCERRRHSPYWIVNCMDGS